MVRDLGAGRGADYGALHADYEARESLEARLVKAADIVDLLAQALVFERAGARDLGEFWEGARERDFGLKGAAQDVVAEMFGALIAAREALQ
jgi:5'-deoxynucleotidase YfbR-like HD superfamily hydrolase